MTQELFREDAYLKFCQARVAEVAEGGVVLDRTVFYPLGGGQPGDRGRLLAEDGRSWQVVDSRKSRESGRHLHLLAEGVEPPEPGLVVQAEIDWEYRHRLMRMHSSLHLLCSLVDAPVTGGSVGPERSRLDFDLDCSPEKQPLEAALNALIRQDIPVEVGSITDQQLDDSPELVRTLSVQPPRGLGRVRTIRIGDVDYQPCGGTHVASTAEIGGLRVGKIEKKGKRNRRIHIHLLD